MSTKPMGGRELAGLLRTALAAVAANPEGHLNLQLRRQIRGAFGEVVGVHKAGGPSHAVRVLVALDTMTAKRVIHHWERALPTDRGPHRILGVASAVLNGIIDLNAARQEQLSFSNHVWNPSAHPTWNPPAPDEEGRVDRVRHAGAAALRTVATAFGAELTDEEAPPTTDDPEDADDEVLDWDMWNCEMYASRAEAPLFTTGRNALLGFPRENVGARRAFWRWWLTVAVPRVAGDAGIDLA